MPKEPPHVRTRQHRTRQRHPDRRRAEFDGGRRAATPDRPTLTVTVLIPAHNEQDVIAATVRSCLEQTHRPEQVIVVDDGSTDDTAQAAAVAGAVVVHGPGGLKSRAQNLGLAAVTTDLMMSVDADTVLEPDTISQLVATIAAGYDGTCAAVRPQQTRGLFVHARTFEYALARRWLKPMQQAVGALHVLSGCAYMFRTDVLRKIGGIPELAIGEDTNLTWTLYAAGYRLAYTSDAVVRTREPETLREYLGQIRRWASSCYQCIARHHRQLIRPGRALVVGTALWDMLSVWVSYAVLAYIAARHGLQWAGVFSLWGIATQAAAVGVAARDLGARRAVACWPAHAVVGLLTRTVYTWTLIREWILGRHYDSWTGRQGRKTVITPMTGRRKAVLAYLSVAAALVGTYTLTG